MHVMKIEDAKRHNLYTIDPVTGKQVPFTTWRVELTKEQKEAEQKQVADGTLPF